MKIFRRSLIVISCMLFAALNCTKGASFSSDWKGSHIWVGPEYWANPLQDWRVEKGELVGFAAHDRSLHLLTHHVENTSGGFEMEVEVRLDVGGGGVSEGFVRRITLIE